ncbi:MAG: sigma 54-interacting transcriptional regulator [Chloroflexota bacterium]
MEKILIIEDQVENQKVYDYIAETVESEFNIKLVHDFASSYEDAKNKLETEYPNSNTKPVVILLDMEIPRNGYLDKTAGYLLMKEYRWKYLDSYWIPLTGVVSWHEKNQEKISLFDQLFSLQPFDVAKKDVRKLQEILTRVFSIIKSSETPETKEQIDISNNDYLEFGDHYYLPPSYYTGRQILAAAESKRNVLLFGELGTGKSLIARLIHDKSSRRNKSFISVNAETDLEYFQSILFPPLSTEGNSGSEALLEKARGGTLYIRNFDKIGKQSSVGNQRTIQNKLFHYIEYKGFDIRIIGGINKNRYDVKLFDSILPEFLETMIAIDAPPLRKRKEDIPDLIKLILFQYNLHQPTTEQKSIVDPDRINEYLASKEWENGNILELKIAIETVLTNSMSNEVSIEEFKREFGELNSGFPERSVQFHSVINEKPIIVITDEDIRMYKR